MKRVKTRRCESLSVSKEAFKAEVVAWANRMKVEPKEIHIRPMPRKWGSCSTLGRVSFSADLLEQPERFREEIIVHELLHLKVPNHGKLFLALLKAYLGRRDVESNRRSHHARA